MTSNITWTTEKRKLSDLIPVSYNPRKLSKKQADDLRQSLVKFNLAELPVVNADNKILAGHQRCKILADIEGKDFEIEVRVPNRQLDKAEADEYLIRSNKNSGEFDFDLLEEHFEFDDLIEYGFDEGELNFTMEAEFGEEKGLQDLSDELEELIKVEVACDSEEQAEELYNELVKRGLGVKIK